MSCRAGVVSPRVREVAKSEGFLWGNAAAQTYFARAERDVEQIWDAFIEPVIDPLTYSTAVDIGAGRGRHSAKLGTRAAKVICVDINPENVEAMRSRFSDDERFNIILNDGVTLQEIDSETIDLAFSFDSMVHFDIEIVISYINEASGCFDQVSMPSFTTQTTSPVLGRIFVTTRTGETSCPFPCSSILLSGPDLMFCCRSHSRGWYYQSGWHRAPPKAAAGPQ
jgi:SAM-dependent methyltransferase